MAKSDQAKGGESQQEVVSCLENKRLIIKFYPRPKGFIRDPKHVSYGGMLEGAVMVLYTPLMRNGDFKNVLTNDEKAFLEEYMGLGTDALSVYKKEGNYWHDIRVKLEKGENFFDLSSPEDYIKAKVALANDNIVAPSIDVINNKASYKFYAIKEGDEDRVNHKSLTAKQEAYKLYGKIEDDEDVLRYILRVINGASVSKNTKIETIQGWVYGIIEDKTKEFNLILNDKQLRTKILIDKGVQAGAIAVRDGKYYTAEGLSLSAGTSEPTLQNAANYLDMPINQPVRMKIETRIKVGE